MENLKKNINQNIIIGVILTLTTPLSVVFGWATFNGWNHICTTHNEFVKEYTGRGLSKFVDAKLELQFTDKNTDPKYLEIKLLRQTDQIQKIWERALAERAQEKKYDKLYQFDLIDVGIVTDKVYNELVGETSTIRRPSINTITPDQGDEWMVKYPINE